MAVQAETISVNPVGSLVNNGAVFAVSIESTGFDIGTLGGGFSLSWDPTILTLQTKSLTFAGDQGSGRPEPSMP